MSYQTKATQITTEAEFYAAAAAGARIEYTACGLGGLGVTIDTYALPPHDQPGSGGWILQPPGDPWIPLRPGELMRAFYPATSTEEPEA